MKKRSYFLGTAIVLMLSMILAACGGGSGDSSDGGGDNDSKVDFVAIATGGTGGTYYPLGGTFGKLITDETDIKHSVETSGASAENMATLKAGDVQIAFTQTDIASYAVEGTQMFNEKIDNARGIGTLYPETIQIVTTKDSGIKSVEDLKGKVVSVGEAGSGTLLNAEQILEVHGMTTDDLEARNLSFDDSTNGIQDGTIDAAFITGGTPVGAVEGLAATEDISIVPIEQDMIDSLIEKYPYYAKDEIPADTYSKIAEPVTTVAVRAMLVTYEDMPEDVVYNITKAIFENTDKIQHAKGELISAETALDGMGIELHPGAKKYFDEKGISKE
ncbi:TRAP transporter TAXI family solute receptor [Bacillus pakistanensis]|uniref:TRAP transporter TAXI family solute receptor n=1 Tax=Rossellomorea pakistanensis TaxID=992288 RepID=A0ABS2NFD2_9BACI|nr:TAXI family TRAP transporter solute-binding subunit [Bacillus pakistanensis]MBM7586565.1 TRAP transporter TAXI family solute receptor [Bacillus pakistanensis]